MLSNKMLGLGAGKIGFRFQVSGLRRYQVSGVRKEGDNKKCFYRRQNFSKNRIYRK
jgi:hypothetical protein